MSHDLPASGRHPAGYPFFRYTQTPGIDSVTDGEYVYAPLSVDRQLHIVQGIVHGMDDQSTTRNRTYDIRSIDINEAALGALRGGEISLAAFLASQGWTIKQGELLSLVKQPKFLQKKGISYTDEQSTITRAKNAENQFARSTRIQTPQNSTGMVSGHSSSGKNSPRGSGEGDSPTPRQGHNQVGSQSTAPRSGS